MSVLCTICARGGSKGVPNKNIRVLMGKPLVAHTIEQALAAKQIDRVIVSTDSDKIAAVSREYGADVPFMRPGNLANDSSPKLPVIQHMVNFCIKEMNFVPEYVIDLDPTSPLRIQDDITRCLELIINDPDCDSVITGYRSNKNPYYNMVELNCNGFARVSKETEKIHTRRQDSPVVYAMNASIYVWKREILLKQKNILSGNVKFFEMPEDRSNDIDSETDFELVELLLKKMKRKKRKN